MPRPHIQVILADHAIPPTLREAVRCTGASASFRHLPEVLRGGLSSIPDAIVIVVPDALGEQMHSLRVLFDHIADQPRATLLLRANGGVVPSLAHPPTVPVTFGCELDTPALAARLATMLEMRASLDSLHRSMVANRVSEERATQSFEKQLRLASQVQRELLPETLPTFGRLSFSVVFRPVDYVSGDVYDVHQLDEHHVAIALADATGHGMPAALLTVFIKRALRGKEMEDGRYRLLRPDEVLTRLNDDLLDANLSNCPFVAATYAVLDTRTLQLALARGGTPYPLLRRADGTVELLRPAGGVVGVLPEARFEVQSVQLEEGDGLIFCSDGLEQVILPQLPAQGLAEAFTRAARFARLRWSGAPDLLEQETTASTATLVGGLQTATASIRKRQADKGASARAAGAAARAGHNGESWHDAGVGVAELDDPAEPHVRDRATPAPDEALLATPWCDLLRDAGVPAALEYLTGRHDALRRMGHPLDDLTVVALQVTG